MEYVIEKKKGFKSANITQKLLGEKEDKIFHIVV